MSIEAVVGDEVDLVPQVLAVERAVAGVERRPRDQSGARRLQVVESLVDVEEVRRCEIYVSCVF